MMNDLLIKKLSVTDVSCFENLIILFEAVFEMKKFSMPTSEYLRELLAKENFHVFVALKEGSVIGGLTAYTLNQYYSQKPLAYIFDLAVASLWQRQGIGNALSMHTKSYFRQNGYSEVFVQADRVDDYAIDFYRKTKPTEEEDVLHFYYTLD
ncbi:GNAT family N-acetyltransferase [Olivibacter jilunii]|uniref:GNAT family N-acetyltransferase n=1 Tax=Olivibacter jilunii TaxID=985016 RepID=UPI003F17E685